MKVCWDGWLICVYTALSVVFQSYHADGGTDEKMRGGGVKLSSLIRTTDGSDTSTLIVFVRAQLFKTNDIVS